MSPTQLTYPSRVDRFVLHRQLGAGGMGVVHLAYDPKLGREVALKLLRLDRSNPPKRLLQEARCLAQLSHPNVVQLFEVGEWGGLLYIAMEYVPGLDLGEWLTEHAPQPAAVATLLVDVARGLAASHAAGVVHRDIKLSNIRVGDDGRVRLLDFGLARIGTVHNDVGETKATQHKRAATSLRPRDLELTAPGTVMGTLLYMAPEQIEGQAPTPNSDQYSFCVVAYRALMHKHPFGAAPAWARSRRQVKNLRPQGRVAARLLPLIVRGLDNDEHRRWGSVAELADEMEAVLRKLARTRRVALALTGAAVLAAAGIGSGSTSVPGCEEPDQGLQSVWNDRRRAAIEEAALATGVAHAAATSASLVQRVDAYAEDWIASYGAACSAGSKQLSEPRSDWTMICLDQRRRELTAALGVLSTMDARLMVDAVAVVAAIESPARCLDPSSVHGPRDRPRDSQSRVELTRLETRLTELAALLRAGRYTQAERLASELDGQRHESLYPAFVARLDLVVGRLQARLEHSETAEDRLGAAFFSARALGLHEVAFDAAVELMIAVDERGDVRDEALRVWGRHAEALLGRFDDPRRLASLLSARGEVLGKHGDEEGAIVAHRAAIDALEEHEGGNSLLLSDALNELAISLARSGEPGQARAVLLRSLSIRTAQLGEGHPSLGSVLVNVANTLTQQGDHRAAMPHLRRALSIHEAALGPEHPATGRDLVSLGDALVALGEYEEAYTTHARALEILERQLSPDHPDVAYACNNLAVVVGRLGRTEDAIALYQRTIDIRERTLGSDHPLLINPLTNMGREFIGRGQLDVARSAIERALEVAEHSDVANHITARPLLALAALERAHGDFKAAAALARRAVEMHASSPVSALALAKARFELAQATDALGERAQAIALARRALGTLDEPGNAQGETIEQVTAWLRERGA